MVSMQVLPASMKEAVRIYQDLVIPAASRQRGFRGALMLTDSDTGVGVSITMWDSEANTQSSEASGFYHEKLDKFDTLFISARLQALRSQCPGVEWARGRSLKTIAHSYRDTLGNTEGEGEVQDPTSQKARHQLDG